MLPSLYGGTVDYAGLFPVFRAVRYHVSAVLGIARALGAGPSTGERHCSSPASGDEYSKSFIHFLKSTLEMKD